MSKDNPASKPSVADGGKTPIDISDNKPLTTPTPSGTPLSGQGADQHSAPPVDNHGDKPVETANKPAESHADKPAETDAKDDDQSDDGKAKAKAKKDAKDDAYNTAFTQGRTAKANAISKDDAPYDAESNEYKAWLKGWKSMET